MRGAVRSALLSQQPRPLRRQLWLLLGVLLAAPATAVWRTRVQVVQHVIQRQLERVLARRTARLQSAQCSTGGTARVGAVSLPARASRRANRQAEV